MAKTKKNKENVDKKEVAPVVPKNNTSKPKKEKKVKTQGSNGPEVPLFSKDAAFVLFNLFIYSFAMFTLPFASFFATKYILQDHFQVTGFPNTCASVIAAVLTVNLIIIMYAIKGFQESVADEKEDLKKSKTKNPKPDAKQVQKTNNSNANVTSNKKQKKK